MGPISVQIESPILPPNEAVEVGGDAPANEECEGMDVDTVDAVKEVDDEEDVAKTQDDSLSLPNLDSHRFEVEEVEEEAEPSDTKVWEPFFLLVYVIPLLLMILVCRQYSRVLS